MTGHTALTARQVEYALMIASGRTRDEAAAELGVSVSTIKSQLVVVRAKLRLPSTSPRALALALVARGYANPQQVLDGRLTPTDPPANMQ